MKKARLNKSSILCILFFISCGKPLPNFENVDLKLFAEDKNACKENRAKMLSAIDDQKEKLLGLSEMQIVDLLGNPDHNELYKRNQKFYYYFLQPSVNCNKASNTPQRLIIRFNAMGLAKEVSVES
jgi:hypothetical protein